MRVKALSDSKVIFKERTDQNASHLVTAFKQLTEKIDTKVSGQFGHTIIIQTGNVKITNSELDCEFSIPFDDDTEANEAEIIVYNLTNTTINNIKNKAKITVTAGYGSDTGVIFSGYIAKRSIEYDDCDKVLTVKAVDDINRQEKELTSITYAKGTKSSKILKDLCQKVGLPIATFSVKRDHTYTDEETVDGDLFDNIRRLAKICGVSAYILKGKIYVRPLGSGDNTTFTLSADTGLLDISPFEETETNEEYNDVIKGYDVEMLLQHKIQTASIITVKSKSANGKFRVRSGEHKYDGKELTTTVKVVSA
jgi:hypothetical protein